MSLTVTGWIEKLGMAVFGACSNTGSPYGIITGVNTSGLSFTRNGSSCAFNPAVLWESDTQQSAIVGVELWCGSVSGVAIVDGGEGFTGTPTASASGVTFGTPTMATGVTSVTVNTPGSGFALPPSVTITGTGTGATAHVVIRSNRVVGVVVDAGGTGYTGTPTATLTGGASGSGATLQAVLSGSSIGQINVLTMGTAYPNPPAVTVQATAGGTIGPNGNTSASYRAVVYDSLGSDGAGANAGGIRAVIPDLGGGRASCGTGYTGTTATATVSGGSGVSLTGNVSSYVAFIPVTSGGSNFNARPAITVSGGGSTRACSAVAMMQGPINTDVFTYTAPASFISATVGGTPFTSSSATAAAMTNSVGVQEGSIGPMLEAGKPITLDIGCNLGSFNISSGAPTYTAANLMMKAAQWGIAAGTGVVTYNPHPDGATPATWTSPTSMILATGAGNNNAPNLLDSTGCPCYLGKYVLKYIDANVNTSSAQPVWFGTSANNTSVTPTSLSGDASPVPIPWGNVTISGGVITAVSLTTPTLVSFTPGYQAAGIFLGTTGNSTFVASVRCSGGFPTNVDIHCGGSGFSSGSPQTLVIYGTSLSGTDVTAQFDVELFGTFTLWSPGLQIKTANKSGAWAISNPRTLAPAGTGGAPNLTSPASQLSTAPHILAALTATNGRPARRIRYMDRTSEQGSNLVLPSDYAPMIARVGSSNNKWLSLNSCPDHMATFRYARIINTDPAKGPIGGGGDGTYASVTTRMYTTQPWAQFFDSTFTLSATTTTGSPVVICTNMVNGSAALMVGSPVTGTGIPSGSYVAYFGMLTSGTLTSGSATIAGIPPTAATLLAAIVASGNLNINLANSNAGIPVGTQVTAVNTSLNTLTLSANATASGPFGLSLGDNLCFTLGGNTPPTWALPLATATGSTTITVQNPGYISLPTADMGLSVNNNFGSPKIVVCELRSLVPHGMVWPQIILSGDVGIPFSVIVNSVIAQNAAWTITGTITSGSNVITGVANTYRYGPNMAVYAPTCLPTPTRIVSVNAGASTITLDGNATANGTSAIVSTWIPGGGFTVQCYVTGPYTIAFYVFIQSGAIGSTTPPSGNVNGPQWFGSDVEVDLSSTAYPGGWTAEALAPDLLTAEPYEYGIYLSKELGDSIVHRNLPIIAGDNVHYMIGYRDAMFAGPNTVVHLEGGNELWNNGLGFPAGVWLYGITTQMTYITGGSINGHATAPLSSSLSTEVTAHVLTLARASDQYIAGWTAAGGNPAKVVRGVASWWGSFGNGSATALTTALLTAGATYNAGFQICWIAPYLSMQPDAAIIQAMAPYGSPIGNAGGWAIPRINGFLRNWLLYNVDQNSVVTTHAGICAPFGVALASYEGSLQNPIPNPVPNQFAIMHDQVVHQSAAEIPYAWFQAFGNAGGTGATWFNYYFQWFTTSDWFLATSTSVLPGLDPNAGMATYQGGAPADQHDHGQYNALAAAAVSPMAQGFLNALQAMGPYVPPAPPLPGRAATGTGPLLLVI